MKRILSLLAVGAALTAVAPASASAAITAVPAQHSFEITSDPYGQIRSSLPGFCWLGKITGYIPSAPNNSAETVLYLPIATPTAACEGGASITFGAGEWKFAAARFYVTGLYVPANGITMRYASLPGCKLTNPGSWTARGYWSNGVTGVTKTVHHFAGEMPVRWENDGAGTCAMAGQAETLKFGHPTEVSGATVLDKTNSAAVPQLLIGLT